MTSKEVTSTLRISRGTLTNYVKKGLIKTELTPTGRYVYDRESVYSLINGGVRKTYIYARVSTQKQKDDLNNQVELLKQYCFSKGIKIDGIYKDIASGISFEKRTDLFKLLDFILENKVEKIVITYKDRLSRVGFGLFKHLFEKFGCEIEVISEVGSVKLDSQEIFEEIVSLLHSYSMKLYSSRKKKTIKDLITE
ncbi:MAG: IS607 family transposase [Hyphomicrobium sp.]|uniref:IS607 family transposase n=1 Tax=Hyphomicrobium sp. TaxID=82 RepID=UPI003561F2E0